MTRVFADTSALYALLDARDLNHGRAKRAFRSLQAREAPLLATSFVLVETYALLHRRIGLDAVRSFRADLAPLLDVVWVDEALCHAGLDRLFSRGKRDLSLVDAVSFVAMDEARVDDAFAFDPHFAAEGFALVQ